MRSLLAYFIKYPITGNVLLFLILIFGFFGMASLRKTFFPERESNTIKIDAVYPGASPAEVEEGIVLKIEDNLDGLIGIDRITSTSSENLGAVTIEVNTDYNTDEILQDVKNAIDRINSFPDGMEPPSVYVFEGRNQAITFAISGDVGLHQLKHIARRVEQDLRSIDGLSQIELQGFPEEEIEIKVNDDALRKYSLTIEQVALAVANENIDLTGGTIKTKEENVLIRVRNKHNSPLEIEDIIVKALPSGQVIRLRDLAEVREVWEDVPNEKAYNGKQAVVVDIKYTINEDILLITEAVKTYIKKFNEKNKAVHADIINDRSKTLRERIDLLTTNGFIGFVLVLIFLSIFLHPRLAGWVAIAIPVSFAGMFIVSAFYGISINVISLFGMIIVVGILVDDGIVISENIYQHWERGKNPVQAAIDGTLEVLPAVFSAIMTTVIAFSLFFMLDGTMGDFFPEMGFVVIATLMFSLIEGALILPAHIGHSKALKRDQKKGPIVKMVDWFGKVMNWMKDKLYAPVLDFAINQPYVVIAISICLFVLTITGISSGIIRLTVFPNLESDFLSAELKMPPGTSEQVTAKWINYVEEKIQGLNKDLKNEYGTDVIVGLEKTIGPQTNVATLNLVLLPSEDRHHESSELVNMAMQRIGVIPESEKFTLNSRGPFGRPISIALNSSDYDELRKAKNELVKELRAMESLKNVESSDQEGILELNINLKSKARALGLSYREIIGEIRKGFFGREVQRLQQGIDEVKVWVRYDKANRSSIGDLEEMHITVAGQEYLVKDLVNIQRSRGIVSYDHIDGKRSVTVSADLLNPKKDNPNQIQSYVQQDLLEKKIFKNHPSVKSSVEGQIREQAKTGRSLAFAGPIVLILIIACIVLTFRSALQTFAVFTMIPFGIIGVGWGHFIHDAQVSMFSWFGVIALIGIMVNDSLVFISALNVNLKQGMHYKSALREAGLSRFRPILLTSVTTVAGLAPLIAETSFQAQFLIPMAISIAYGLIIATFLTLVFLPSMLKILNRFRVVTSWLISGEVKSSEAVEPAVREKKFESLDL